MSRINDARPRSRFRIIPAALLGLALAVSSALMAVPAHADNGNDPDWPTFIPGITDNLCAEGQPGKVILGLQKANNNTPVDTGAFTYHLKGETASDGTPLNFVLGSGVIATYELYRNGQPAAVSIPANGVLTYDADWKDPDGIVHRILTGTYSSFDEGCGSTQEPTPAKPTVNCPETTKVMGRATGSVKCTVKNNGHAYTGKLYKSGKLVRTYTDVSSGSVMLRLGYGSYRLVTSNSGGSSYDDFRVAYKDQSAWITSYSKGTFCTTATHVTNKVLWEDGKKKHGTWKYGKDHYLTKSGVAKTYCGNGPDVKPGEQNKVRVTVNGQVFTLNFDRRSHS